METAKSILLMWSGGIASTCALLRLLSDPQYSDYDIVVHHLHIHDIRAKAAAEASACKSVIEYVSGKKKYRKFFLSESSYEYTFLQPPRYSNTIADADIINFVAANICSGNPAIQHIVLGNYKAIDDDGRLKRSKEIFESSLVSQKHYSDITLDYPLSGYTIRDLFNEIPRPLRRYTWSCLLPVKTGKGTYRQCGECFKCKLRKASNIVQ